MSEWWRTYPKWYAAQKEKTGEERSPSYEELRKFLAPGKFRCYQCGQRRHYPFYEGQFLCNLCLQQAARCEFENCCTRCGKRFLCASPYRRRCPRCYRPRGSDDDAENPRVVKLWQSSYKRLGDDDNAGDTGLKSWERNEE